MLRRFANLRPHQQAVDRGRLEARVMHGEPCNLGYHAKRGSARGRAHRLQLADADNRAQNLPHKAVSRLSVRNISRASGLESESRFFTTSPSIVARAAPSTRLPLSV